MQKILIRKNIIWTVVLSITGWLTWQTYQQENEIVSSPVRAVARAEYSDGGVKVDNSDEKQISDSFELVLRVKETRPYFNLFAVPARKIEKPGINIERAALPVAPVLPFKYLGMVTEENETKLILEHQGDVLAVKVGDSLGVNYKLLSTNKVANNTVFSFLYLPMNITQTMVVKDVSEH